MWEYITKHLLSKLMGCSAVNTETPLRGIAQEISFMQDIAHRVADSQLKDFLLSRLEGLQSVLESPDVHVLQMVDFLDELSCLSDYPPAERAAIGEISDRLREILKAEGVELLRSADWTPALQRAVKVNRVLSPGAFPVVVRSLSTGARIDSRLLRKQEVELDMPAEPPASSL